MSHYWVDFIFYDKEKKRTKIEKILLQKNDAKKDYT